MWNLKVIAIMLLLIMSSFVFVSGFDDPVCESGSVGVLGVGGVDDTEKPSRDNEVDGTRALARLLQDTAHGGEWLDSFEDDSKIDWTMSDHIYMNNNDIIMDIRPAVDPNTVALWHFDESSGNTANDVTSNNHDGTISGATWVPGLFGSALSFDGTNDYVLVSDHDDFSIDTTGKLSIEFWMRTGNDVTSRQDVFGKGGQSPSGPWEWTIMVMNGKLIGTYVQASNGGSLRIEDVSISTNTWYHVIIVFRGYTQNDNIDIYLNGVEKSVLQFQTGNTYSNTAGDFGIGRGYGSSAWRYFNGTLDEIRISNCIRSPISYYANLTSNQINLPENMRWDTFIINKTEPQKNFINITILNASNDQLIPGSPTYIDDGEFDISYIDPIKYPSIKLNATFEGQNLDFAPALHYWGVSWNETKTWRDTFFGGTKVESSNNIDVIQEKVQAMRNQTEFEVDSNTLALWHFNEGSGTTVNDETTNNNDGTISGASWTTGRFGKGLSFDGVNDYVDCGNKGIWNFGSSDFTIEAWVKTSDTGDNPIVGRRQSNNMMDIRVDGSNDGKVLFTAGMGGTYHNAKGKTEVNDGNWHNIVGVREYNKDLVIYVDGVDDTTTTSSDDDVISINRELLLGGRQGSTIPIDAIFKGTLDEIRISNSGRTAQEIKDLYLGTGFKEHSVIESKPIEIPAKNSYDRLMINKSEPAGNYLNVTILDALTDTPIEGFEKLTGTDIDLSSINPIDHPSVKLKGIFESNREDTPLLYDWSINWTNNNPPKFIDATSELEVYRTQSVGLRIDFADKEQHESLLTLKVEYKASFDLAWQDDYISDQYYDHEIKSWLCNFMPTINAELGFYSFRFSCNNSLSDFNITIVTDFIEVLNNKPTKPEIMLLPADPRTADDLSLIAWNSTDIETPANNIEYWYRWYRDGFFLDREYMVEFENLTVIPNNETKKGENWECHAYPFDGIELGPPAEVRFEINNTPPSVTSGVGETFNSIEMFEDSIKVLNSQLYKIFTDDDYYDQIDDLSFYTTGQENISVTINQDNGTLILGPKPNWFGAEYITFYANDYHSPAAQKTVEIKVNPINDLPEIVSVGNQLTTADHSELDFVVNEGEWLNLTIKVSDIDGDVERGVIKYISNITGRENLFIDQNKLFFQPSDADLGWHFINISVTDNNDIPIKYISQRIRIHVLNVNDPPTVEIINPKDGSEFSENEKLTLTCQSTDLDFKVKEYSETHTYRWYTDKSELGDLGNGLRLTNITLPPGNYTLFVEVQDKGKAKALDSIKIKIKEVPKPTPSTGERELSSNMFIWLGLIILIIIIVLIIVLYFVLTKKKKEERLAAYGIPQQEVLQPVAAYQPDRQLPAVGPAAPSLITQSVPQVTASTAAVQPTPLVGAGQVSPEPAAQLPPTSTQPVIQPTPTQTEDEQNVGIGSELTPQQKLVLLEERLIRGEIDQDIYLNLKAKYDLEAKPYKPAPQLPPAQTPLSTPEQLPITTQVPQAPVPDQQPPPEPVVPLQETPPPEAVQPPMEQPPVITEMPVEPVQQPPPDLPPDLPPDVYQHSPTQPTPQPQQPPIQPQPQAQPAPPVQLQQQTQEQQPQQSQQPLIKETPAETVTQPEPISSGQPQLVPKKSDEDEK